MFLWQHEEYPSYFDMLGYAEREWKKGKKERAEIMRHARVSIDNRHKCRECYCCACAEIWRGQGRRGHV